MRFFLLLGVLGGSGLALLAGLMVARRAMAPIAALTASAREIERTRDPSRHMPQPEADDEVAELARTLEGMLEALDAARAETEAALSRQREFVADASHELRTPLTSVLANLELLAEQLDGEDARGGAARRCAPRGACAGSSPTCCCSRAPTPAASVPHRPTDLAAGAARGRRRARAGRRASTSSRSSPAAAAVVRARATICTASRST